MDIINSFGPIYQSPDIRIIEFISEGLLCASGDEQTELIGENLGTWG